MNANDFPAEFLNQQKTQRAEPRAQDSRSVASIGGSDLLFKDEVRITGHKVGVLLNFKRAKLEWERMVLSNH